MIPNFPPLHFFLGLATILGAAVPSVQAAPAAPPIAVEKTVVLYDGKTVNDLSKFYVWLGPKAHEDANRFLANFAEELVHSGKAQVQVIADGSDPNTATIVVNYLSGIIGAYQQQLNPTARAQNQVTVQVRQLYNEEQNGSLNFIPGVIALIFMIVSTALTSVSIVKEKETGTMEILLVSPFKPLMVLFAKAIPYLVLSLINFIIILLLSVFLLHVEIRGSLLLLFTESILFIITCLSLGLLISNVTNSQQTAMLISMMGMMLPTLLLTGFMFPLENMPWIFQAISHVLPSRYYYIIMKAVMLKGLPFSYVWKETLILTGMAILLLAVAVKNFKTRLS